MKKFTKKMKVGASLLCTLAVLGTVIPTAVINSNTEVDAAGNAGEYRVKTTLYDYKYDSELYSGYKDNTYGGNRWNPSDSVPYELFNEKISNYYSSRSGLSNQPALYFGNFYGSRYGYNPHQYKGNDNTNVYVNYYSNFDIAANNAPNRGTNDSTAESKNARTAIQGLVDKKLTNGQITQNSVALPQFNDTWLTDTNDSTGIGTVPQGSNSDRISTTYADVFDMSANDGFIFDANTTNGITTYSYDSLTDLNRYYDKTNSKMVVSTMNNGYRSTRNYTSSGLTNETGFYPFNATNQVTTDRKDVNYGFGMKLEIPFNVSSDGTLTGSNGSKQDMIFNFSGDDDIWVFIDDVLVLDMGGDHGRVSGNINFAEAYKNSNSAITIGSTESGAENGAISNYTYQNTDHSYGQSGRDIPSDSDKIQTMSLANAFSNADESYNASTFFDPHTEHTMTIFYMERGMFESNLKVDFNFVPIPNDNTYTLVEETKFDGINEGLVKATKQAADADIFEYAIVNNLNGKTDASATDTTVTYPVSSNATRQNTDAAVQQNTLIADKNQGTSGQAYKFNPNASGDTQVANVKYQLTDPFANPTAGVTDSNGNVKLMYGESARFASQFTTGSTMTVTQAASTKKPDATTGAIGATDSTRLVAQYYDTTVTVEDKTEAVVGGIDNMSLANYRDSKNSQFTFQNNTPSEPTQITQTFVNTPKVGSLKIEKKLSEGAAEDSTTDFTFKVTFNDVFGQYNVDTDSVDYANVKITVNSVETTLTAGGTFQMKAGQSATITGIPYNTAYDITETESGNYVAGYISKSGTTSVGETVVTVTNTPKEADKIDLTLTKKWTGTNDSENIIPEKIYVQLLSRPHGSDVAYTVVEGYDKVTIDTKANDANLVVSEDKTTWTYTFRNLPKDRDYMIREYTMDGNAVIITASEDNPAFFSAEFRTVYNDQLAAPMSDDNAFEITNNYSPTVLPKTGGEGVRYFVIFGAGTILLAGGALFLLRKKTLVQSANGGKK